MKVYKGKNKGRYVLKTVKSGPNKGKKYRVYLKAGQKAPATKKRATKKAPAAKRAPAKTKTTKKRVTTKAPATKRVVKTKKNMERGSGTYLLTYETSKPIPDRKFKWIDKPITDAQFLAIDKMASTNKKNWTQEDLENLKVVTKLAANTRLFPKSMKVPVLYYSAKDVKDVGDEHVRILIDAYRFPSPLEKIALKDGLAAMKEAMKKFE